MIFFSRNNLFKYKKKALEIIQQVIKKCPNIVELHIETENQHDPIEPMPIDYFTEFRFKHLRRLSIDGSHHVLSDVSSLPQVNILLLFLYFKN